MTETCSACGNEIRVGEWPFCPHGFPEAPLTVINDSIPGGMTIENMGPAPITFYSKSDWRREMKARGLFADKTGTLVLTAKQAGEDVEAILSWDDSRHTLAGNTTIVPQENIEALVRGTLLKGQPSVVPSLGRRVKSKGD